MSKKTIAISSKSEFDSLVSDSRIVVADFWAEWCGPCKQIAPIFETLAESLSHPNFVAFVKIDADAHKDIASEHNVTALPTFIVFRDGKEVRRVKGADSEQLQIIIQKLADEVDDVKSGGNEGTKPWKGADGPRNFLDITSEVETRGCELLNAAEDAGPVKVLFEDTKPSVLLEKNSFKTDWVQSGADDQLLLYIPLQSTVKLHTLQITSLPPKDDEDVMRPAAIHLYVNRSQNLDFDEAEETEPTQAIELSAEDWNENGTINASLRYVKFQKTSSLVIFVQRGDGEGETVRLDRIKLFGEAGAKRDMGKLQKVGEDE